MCRKYLLCSIVLLQFCRISFVKCDYLPNCTAPKTPGENRNYLVNLLKDHHSKNWNRIVDITKSIGIPLQNWRHSHRICIRGDGIVISASRTRCFDTKDFSNITRRLYMIFTESYETDHTPNLKVLDNLSHHVDKFKTIDYYIFLKCLLLVSDHIHAEGLEHFMKILTNMMNSSFSDHKRFIILHKFASVLFGSRRNLMIVQPNYILTLWHPFRTNISGYALYEAPNYVKGFDVRPIYKNETSEDVDKHGLKIAGIIPGNFLKRLTRNVSQKDKSHLVVQMLMMVDDQKFSEYFHLGRKSKDLIGVSIPSYCKSDNMGSILQAYFYDPNNENSWRYHGANYKDPPDYELSDLCLLDRLTYFFPSNFNVTEEPLETPLQQNCSRYYLRTNTSTIEFKRYKDNFILHPKNLCLNIDLQIPALVCREGIVFDNGDFDVTCFQHPRSNITADFYDKLFRIYSLRPTNFPPIANLLNNSDLTYTDVKIYFFYLKQIEIQHETAKSVMDLLERGLKLINEQVPLNRRVNYVANFLTSFLISLPIHFDHQSIVKRSNFIYTSIDPTYNHSIYGIVLYKRSDNASFMDYQIKPLTLANLTVDYTCDRNVDVVFMFLYPSEISTQSEEKLIFNVFIVDNDPKVSDSKILAVHTTYGCQETPFEFGVFLRSGDGPQTDHNWFVVNSQSEVISLVYTRPDSSDFVASSGKKKIRMIRHIQSPL